jgi:ketosteroid isomerase-like protein
MSEENVENVRRSIDAWNRDDLDGWLAGFAPEAELHTTGRFADERVYRGVRGWSGTGRKSTRPPRRSRFRSPTCGPAATGAPGGDGQGAGQAEQGAGRAADLGRYDIARRTGRARRDYVDRAEALEAAGPTE